MIDVRLVRDGESKASAQWRSVNNVTNKYFGCGPMFWADWMEIGERKDGGVRFRYGGPSDGERREGVRTSKPHLKSENNRKLLLYNRPRLHIIKCIQVLNVCQGRLVGAVAVILLFSLVERCWNVRTHNCIRDRRTTDSMFVPYCSFDAVSLVRFLPVIDSGNTIERQS